MLLFFKPYENCIGIMLCLIGAPTIEIVSFPGEQIVYQTSNASFSP